MTFLDFNYVLNHACRSQTHRWQMLGSAWLMTTTGRVIGDAHWVSDTVAAGCLALSAASALALCARGIEQADFLRDAAAVGARVGAGQDGQEAALLESRRGPAGAMGAPRSAPQSFSRRV